MYTDQMKHESEDDLMLNVFSFSLRTFFISLHDKVW